MKLGNKTIFAAMKEKHENVFIEILIISDDDNTVGRQQQVRQDDCLLLRPMT